MKSEDIYNISLAIVAAFLVISIYLYDASELRPRVFVGQVTDKEIVIDCTPVRDADGRWIGDSCADIFHLKLNTSKVLTVKKFTYEDFLVGDLIQKNWDVGRLGFSHNARYCHPRITKQ
jgi:hypothetical protein